MVEQDNAKLFSKVVYKSALSSTMLANIWYCQPYKSEGFKMEFHSDVNLHFPNY